MFFLKIKTSVCIFYFCTIENVSLLKCLFVCLFLNQMIKLNHVLYRLPTPYSTWMLWTHLLLLKWLLWSWGPRIVVTNSNDIVLNYKWCRHLSTLLLYKNITSWQSAELLSNAKRQAGDEVQLSVHPAFSLQLFANLHQPNWEQLQSVRVRPQLVGDRLPPTRQPI